ncbi:hypothetical protein FRB97_003840 [Tulasnella sp. 331]|nr:hypothetical protein FRB97_003840 [Tulasnella sp. 331]
MLALWQAINPNVWVTRGSAEDGTWAIAANSSVDATSSLAPFWNGPQSYWTSAEATKFTNLGYTYPEFVGLNLGDVNGVRAAIGAKVNQLYGSATVKAQAAPPPAPAHVSANLATPAAPAHPAAPAAPAHAAAPAASAPTPPHVASAPPAPAQHHSVAPPSGAQTVLSAIGATISTEGARLYDWVARIQTKKYELGGSFSVVIFIGDFPEDPRQWRTSRAYVGAHHAFVNSNASRCENCRNQQEIVSEGFVHLDEWLAAHSGLGSFEPHVVEPYLKQNLHWRIQKGGSSS